MKNQLLASFLGLLLACLPASGVLAQNSASELVEVVCINTTLGEFCIRLFPEDAPKTVANFLNYVNGGDYTDTFFHRSVSGFVVQGGGYKFDNFVGAVEIAADPPVVNEFKRSNTRGTVAMAKLGTDPNSATNEWFINLGDNSQNLDGQNGGFTVFGEVVLGMNIVESIARLPSINISNILGSAFTDVPLLGFDNTFTVEDFVTIISAKVEQRSLIPVATEQDRFPGVTALATYAANIFSTPIQWTDGRLYRMVFVQNSTPPTYVFAVDTLVITQMTEKGQKRAIFDGEILTVPSIRVGANIITNVRFRLTDRRKLEFTLLDYTQYSGVEPL